MPPTESTVRQYGGYRHTPAPNPRPTSDPADVVRWWKERVEKPLFVYFIQDGDDGPVKIGKAYDPVSRLSELQCGNPRELKLRCVVLARNSTEGTLHGNWGGYRKTREWFGDVDRCRQWGGYRLLPPDHPNVQEEILAGALRAQGEQVEAALTGATDGDVAFMVISIIRPPASWYPATQESSPR